MKLSTLPIYDKQIEILQSLPEGQLEPIIRAVFAYSQDEELPDLDPMARGIFEFIKISIDATKAKVEGGSKGGSKTQAKAKQDEAEPKHEPSNTEADTEVDASIDQASVKDRSSIGQAYAEQVNNEELKNEKVKKTSQSALYERDFEALWALYPKKQGRREAFEAFKRAVRDGDTVDEIRTGIMKYVEFIEQTKTEPRYVKHGSTYFRQRAWKDVYVMPQKGFGYDMRADDMSDVLMEL